LPVLRAAWEASSCPQNIQDFIVSELNKFVADHIEPISMMKQLLETNDLLTPRPPLYLLPFFALFMDFYTLCLMFRNTRRTSQDMPERPSTLVLYEGALHTRMVFQFLVQQLDAQVLYNFETDKRYVKLPVEFQL
jgi:hypothetical protein